MGGKKKQEQKIPELFSILQKIHYKFRIIDKNILRMYDNSWYRVCALHCEKIRDCKLCNYGKNSRNRVRTVEERKHLVQQYQKQRENISVSKFAKEAGVPRTSFSEWLRGQSLDPSKRRGDNKL